MEGSQRNLAENILSAIEDVSETLLELLLFILEYFMSNLCLFPS